MRVCQKPCKECPFTKTSLPGYLGGVYENGKELHDLVVTLEKPFSCHIAQGDSNVSYNQVGSQDFPVCAGSVLYMRKLSKLPKNLELAKLVREADTSLLDNILSFNELIEHHKHSIGYEKPKSDYSIGKRSSEEVQNFLLLLEQQRKNTPKYNFFGDNNWDIIDGQIQILTGEVNEDDIYSMGIDEDSLGFCDLLNTFEWIKGYMELDEFFENI